MSRFENDREDILREATALVRRIEFQIPGMETPVTVGFRRDGTPSFYLGGDLVLQFNSRGELRRGFSHGQLLKAVEGTLVIMERRRTEGAVELRSRPLGSAETAAFLDLARRTLAAMNSGIQQGMAAVLRQVPAGQDILAEVAGWLASHSGDIVVARAPNAG